MFVFLYKEKKAFGSYLNSFKRDLIDAKLDFIITYELHFVFVHVFSNIT